MIIKTENFKNVCSTILNATDNSELSTLTETLELEVQNKTLFLNVTNGEYYASVSFSLDADETFHAAVNANLFLKLIAAVTTEDIDLSIEGNTVIVKANGVYKIPMISEMVGEDGKVLNLPKIEINNPTVNMEIGGAILESILNYNSKELLRGAVSRPVQKMFYMDEQGCITFTTGACINNFTLPQPVKVLFNSRLVKLFKLFKNNMVDFTLGYDELSEDLIQTKVRFKTDNITLTAITGCNDELLNSVPVSAIRGRATADYLYNGVLNKKELAEAINRLLLFSAGYGTSKNAKPYSLFECTDGEMTIWDSTKSNKETIKFKNNINVTDAYLMTLDLSDLKLVLDTITEDYITLSFGNHQAVALRRTSIVNIIPECKTI